jgi:hypothetical protein
MRLATAPCFVLALLVAEHCHAAQSFLCDGATVRIEIIARESPAWEDRPEAVVTVSRDNAETVLRYQNIDFIGGQCVAGSGAPPLVVFQAYCGGSGCRDLANWGVVDPKTLRVLMVPSDSNRDETRKLIGGGALPRLQMMNVLAEARELAIDVP